MTWPAALWHQWRRDVRRTGWLLLVYIFLLALAVATAAQLGTFFSGLIPVGQAVMLLMPLLVALTIHADSAVHVDAFWAVTPVRTSVLVASKLLYALMLVVLWAVAVGVVLSQWRLLSVPAATDLGTADIFAALVMLLLGTALVTAACPNLATVGVVLSGTVALSVVLMLSTVGAAWSITLRQWWVVAVSISVCAVVLLAHAYRVRTASRVRRGGTIMGGVALVLFTAVTMDGRVSGPQAPGGPVDSGAVVLRVPLAGQPECAGGRLTLPLEVVSPVAWRVELVRPRLDVSLVDGSQVALSSERWMQSAGIWGPMLPSSDARVAGDPATTRVRRTDIVFDLPRGSTPRVCGHVAGVALRVPMRVATPAEVLRLPLASSTTLTASGVRGRLVSAEVTDSTVAIAMRLSMLIGAMARSGTSLGELDYALSHPRERRVLRLEADEGRTSVLFTSDGSSAPSDAGDDPFDDGAEQWDTRALPGLTVMSNRVRLHPYPADRVRPRDLRSWRTSGFLVVIAPRWHRSEVRTVQAAVPVVLPSVTAATRR
ncbi:MAG: hypothetical protein V4813_00565 [Gemmatimonadota bacterium]